MLARDKSHLNLDLKKFKESATMRAIVDFPEAAGPSIVTIIDVLIDVLSSEIDKQ